MQTTTGTIAQTVAELAAQFMKGYKADYTDYLEMVEDCARRGYRPEYCIHGTHQWTDYDNICGGCETEGNRWDYLTYAGYALDRARAAFAERQKRVDALMKLVALQAPLGPIADLTAWASEPVTY